MEEIAFIKKDKKVGILIHDNANLFSNGITQNAYFIYQCLENAGMICQFLCMDKEPSKFRYRDLSVNTISTDCRVFSPSEYHTIIVITRFLTKGIYDICKENKIRIIYFNCGNSMMQHMEDFVKGVSIHGVSADIGQSSFADEMWLIPSLVHSIDYYKITLNLEHIRIVPHLWSHTFLAETCLQYDKKSQSELFYKFASHTTRRMNILIMEPNLALVKNAWVPIIACEKLHRMYPDLIENVFVFNYPSHHISYAMTDHLSLGKKLRKFKRLTMSEIMLHFNSEKAFPVILSYQLYTSLNYVYYEALYYGWPLVHNSLELDGCGYYYPEVDVGKCADAIMTAYNTHNHNANLYLEKAHKYLERTDPLSETNKKIWTQLIDAGIATAYAL